MSTRSATSRAGSAGRTSRTVGTPLNTVALGPGNSGKLLF